MYHLIVCGTLIDRYPCYADAYSAFVKYMTRFHGVKITDASGNIINKW